jgi:hypothetical protein
MSSEDRLLGGRKQCRRTRRIRSRTAVYFHMQQILAQTLHLLHCCKIYKTLLERPISLGFLSAFPCSSGTGIYSPASRHGACLEYPSGFFQRHVFCIEHSPQISGFLQVAGGNNLVALSLHEHVACIGPVIVFP